MAHGRATPADLETAETQSALSPLPGIAYRGPVSGGAMRAKMSDVEGGPSLRSLGELELGRARMVRSAVDEARAILAETEPGTKGWGLIPFPTLHTPTSRFDFRHDERTALAESLAAFVEE